MVSRRSIINPFLRRLVAVHTGTLARVRQVIDDNMNIRNILKTQLNRWVGRFSPEPLENRRREQEYAIGIYSGESPLCMRPYDVVTNPVLTRRDVTDIDAELVADPFMISVDGAWYMFFEALNAQTGKGEIGLATSTNTRNWTYQQIVLTEPFHLSYPCVFESEGDFYMIPESYQAGSVRLYKAELFPTRWKYIRTLLNGSYFVDASIFQYQEKWWLLTESNPEMKHDTLRLYYADSLTSSWCEHPSSPIVAGNGHIARPAGRVIVSSDSIIRFTQDCDPIYGTSVKAFQITKLTTTSYVEREVDPRPVLAASGTGWNARGMHHIDAHRLREGRWIACVDGWDWTYVE